MIELTPAEIERFWTKVQQGPGCRLWTGEVNNRGYGRFPIYRDGRRIRLLAHRVALMLATGIDLGDQRARHRCDTPPCCSPSCLLAGTQVDNMQDAAQRGRIDESGLRLGREQNRGAALAMLSTDKKLCPGCQQVKPLGDFYRASRQLHGRQSRCKGCSTRARTA